MSTRKRPPTARACSVRARKLAKDGKGDSKRGKALAACAATTRRSRPRPKVARPTKSVCRKRAKALQSGNVGRSDRSKVAYRLGLCRKPAAKKTTAKRAPRRNPSDAAKIIGSRTVRSTVRGATFRRRFLLVKHGQETAWIEASPQSMFVGFVSRPEYAAAVVGSGAVSRTAAMNALNAYVGRRGSAW
jgi:hypothetical protein